MTTAVLRVLLVEDSPSDFALLRESLTETGLEKFEFFHAETWATAARLLDRQSFDLMLLDLSLPDVIGRETIRRARSAAPQLPIVVFTGVEDETVGLEAVRLGVQDYLIKGQADGRQTARAIRYAVQRKQTEEALKTAEANLQRERDLLDLRVRERTSELSAANAALQAEIRQRQRAEQAHEQVLRRLSEAEENERGRISRELHDRLGQDFTAVKLGLELIRKQGPFAAEVNDAIIKLEKLADGLITHVHRLAWELRPPALDDLGLELALSRYIAEWSETSRVPVDFHSSGLSEGRLPMDLETTLFRVTQETLTNIARHALARRVSVLLERRHDHVSLIVEDDGRGFDPEAVLRQPGTQGKLGLLGMHERVRLAGGTLDVESTPGIGTSVFVRLPVPASKTALC